MRSIRRSRRATDAGAKLFAAPVGAAHRPAPCLDSPAPSQPTRAVWKPSWLNPSMQSSSVLSRGFRRLAHGSDPIGLVPPRLHGPVDSAALLDLANLPRF